jgi:hypothetical protein
LSYNLSRKREFLSQFKRFIPSAGSEDRSGRILGIKKPPEVSRRGFKVGF